MKKLTGRKTCSLRGYIKRRDIINNSEMALIPRITVPRLKGTTCNVEKYRNNKNDQNTSKRISKMKSYLFIYFKSTR